MTHISGYLSQRVGHAKFVEQKDTENPSVLKLKHCGSWVPLFWNLVGGTLFAYKKHRDQTPTFHFDVVDKGGACAELFDVQAIGKQTFAFGLRVQRTAQNAQNQKSQQKEKVDILILSAPSQRMLDAWKEAISQAIKEKTPPGTAIEKEKTKRSRKSIGMRLKQTAASKVAQTSSGKMAMKGMLNEETRALLQALKKMVTKHSGAKKAAEVEESMIRILLKAMMLERDKKITMDQFAKADAPLRKALVQLTRLNDQLGRMKPTAIQEAFEKAHSYLTECETIFGGLLQPYLSSKSMNRLEGCFGFLGSLDFLKSTWTSVELDEELEMICEAFSNYLAFSLPD